MAEEKLSTNDPLDDDNQSKEGKKRVSYVSKDLKSMVDFVAKVYNQLGHTTFHSNKAIATVHGLSPDSIKMHLSSSQQYKLFELKYGIGYKVTDHFQKIYLPRTENEKRNAIIESLKNPGNKLIFQSELEAANKKTIPIHLTDDKQALFVYPDDITIDDIELVKHQIEGILLRIKLESKKKEQPKKQEGAESPL